MFINNAFKISIITVCYNSEKTIQNAINSVLSQKYPFVEYIIIDGDSTDKTLEIIGKFKDKISSVISEPDNGLYDAMNKGIKAATGDIIGILNSDDFFYDDNVLENIAKAFKEDNIDATIADIVFVKNGSSDNILRRYSSKNWKPYMFAWGFMPPHPSFFVKKSVVDEFGLYKTNYKIAADFELLLRYLLVDKIKYKYLPIITTKMRLGGTSTKGIKSLITINKEILKACRENKIYTNPFMIYSKYFFKPFEFIFK